MTKRNIPGEWDPAEYPFVCTRYEDDGRPCHGRPVPGDDRCARHWGKLDSRMMRRRKNLCDTYIGKGPFDVKGISRIDEDAIFLGAPRAIDPAVALLEEIHRAAGHVKWLEMKVRELTDDTLVWGQTGESIEDGYDAKGAVHNVKKEYGAEVSKWYQLYLEERKHLFKVSEGALRAGIEERRVRLAERSIDILEAAIAKAFADVGIDPHSAKARQAIGTRLREAIEGPQDMFGYAEDVVTAETVVTQYQSEEW